MSKGQVNKKEYELHRKRNKVLYVRCTEEERQQVYKLAEIKDKTIIELLLGLVERELKEE